jgi:hypothetical protein
MNRTLEREQAELQSFAVYAQSDPAQPAPFTQDLKTQAAMLNRWIDGIALKRGMQDFPSLPPWHDNPDASRIPTRIGEFGPLTFQNDDVLVDRLGKERVAKIQLLQSQYNRLFRVQDKGALYAYEIVNFVDGKKSVGEIRDAVSAEYGPIPLEVVADYLKACEEAKIVSLQAVRR